MNEVGDRGTVLLSGATGFVGRHLYPALVSAGYRVRCGSRNPDKASAQWPDRDWVQLDVEDRASVVEAMRGCDAAYFLVHGMGHGTDYPEREKQSARLFASAASELGLDRVVYLGGVVPTKGKASRHLRSREETGEILRANTRTIELRAAMVIGQGSASWTMVRDLAARLPAMILPRWLRNVSYPVFIDDVVAGLLGALTLEFEQSLYLDIPGPERITHRDMLNRTAAALGHDRVMVNVPILSPRLSSYWIALVTRVDLSLAKELVEGVRHDLEPGESVAWDSIGHEPMELDRAVELALADDGVDDIPTAATEARLRELGARFAERIAK